MNVYVDTGGWVAYFDYGPPRVVFVGNRRPKQGHETVA